MSKYITVRNREYRIGETTDGKKAIIRSVSYDLQKYHWAYREGRFDKNTMRWVVVRSGRQVGSIYTSFPMSDEREEEIVAEKLIEFDEKANLQPHIDRT